MYIGPAVGDPTLGKLDFFFSKHKLLKYKKGEVITRAGEVPSGIFYLKKGYVRVYSFSKNGEELSLIIFKPGDIFPVSWAINKVTTSYFVEAMTEAFLWRVPRDQFLKFVKDKPDILFEISRRMLERFLGLMRRMEYMVFGNARAKVASILVICAERFGKKSAGGHVEIEVPLTHNDIATLVGLSRETVSIEMGKLADKELISYRRKLISIANLAALRKESLLD